MLAFVEPLILFLSLSLIFTSILWADNCPPFPRIANCYGIGLTPESNPKDIDEISKTDLLIGGVWCNWDDELSVRKLRQHVQEVRRKNPHIIILDFSASAPYADPEDRTFPVTGWLRQPNGSYIDGWPGTRMINLLKPETIDWLVSRCVRSMRDPKIQGIFDGVFIDCMSGTFDWWACNIATRESYEVDADENGQPDERQWLDKMWTESKSRLAQLVREAIGDDAIFMTNQGGEWSFQYTNGRLFEDDLDYVINGDINWDDVLERYLYWTRTPHKPNVTTIVSSSGITPPFDPWKTLTTEEREALLSRGQNLLNRMRFGLTTTLMGDGYFAYDLHTRWRGQRWWYPEYDAPLGYPKNEAQRQKDGTWRREFEGGTVIVNPTIFDVEVSFNEKRIDVSSGKVSKSFIIPSYDGRIFVFTDEELKEGNIPDPNPLFSRSHSDVITKREDKILIRFNNHAACFDTQGRLLVLTDGYDTVAVGAKAVLVKDYRWFDFEYEKSVCHVIDEHRVKFIGERVDGDIRLRYDQTVSIEDGTLTIRYKWRALTDGTLYAWRQQIGFPVRYYINGKFRIDNIEFVLPSEPEKSRIFERGFNEIIMIQPNGNAVNIRTSQKSFLQDERIYNINEFRILFTPVEYRITPFNAGDEWEYSLTISFP